MVSGILLAAGESTRMEGGFKPLMKWGRRTVVAECVHQMRRSRLDDIYVVLGHREGDIRTRLAGTGVQYAINAEYRRGMLSSVQTGLGMLSPNTDAFLLALVDQPMVTTAVIDQLIAAWEKGDRGIIVPTFNGKSGHPVIISAGYIDDIMQLDDSSPDGLRGFIQSHGRDVLEVPVATDAILEDIDSPADYERLSRLVQPHYEHRNWQP